MFLPINLNDLICNFIIACSLYGFCAILDKKYRNVKTTIILILTGTILGCIVTVIKKIM